MALFFILLVFSVLIEGWVHRRLDRAIMSLNGHEKTSKDVKLLTKLHWVAISVTILMSCGFIYHLVLFMVE